MSSQDKLDQAVLTLSQNKKAVSDADEALLGIYQAQADLVYDDSGYAESVVEYGLKETSAKARVEACEASAKSAQALVDMYQDRVANETTPVFPGGGLPMPNSGESLTPKNESDSVKNIFFSRFQKLSGYDDPTLKSIYGGDFRQMDWEQESHFLPFIRSGGKHMTKEGEKALRPNFPTVEEAIHQLQHGVTVNELQKSVQAAGIAGLGGYAIPPTRANEIIMRSAGLTVVRNAGATVIQLTNSPMITWARLRTDSTVYPSHLRGHTPGEGKAGPEENFYFEPIDLKMHAYHYIVQFTLEVLQYVTNITQIFNEQVAATLAIDEDSFFIAGDQPNRARGMLPGGKNTEGLVEVPSGDATKLVEEQLRALKRGLPAQYRNRATSSYIANSDTWGQIERYRDGIGQYFYPEGLTNGERYLDGTVRETEAMPAIGAGTFPVIYGNVAAYGIVEGMGLRIQRYNDAHTTMIAEQFEVLRYLGGGLLKPWMLAVQKIEA